MSKKIEGGRHSLMHKEWISMVFERDLYICQECFSTENLDAHHIKSWNHYPDLRFKLNNGLTLCKSCHSKLHLKDKKCFHKGNIPWNKGTVGIMVAWNKGISATLEARAKMRGKRKNFIPWNKGLIGMVKISLETKNKMSKAHKGLKYKKRTFKRLEA